MYWLRMDRLSRGCLWLLFAGCLVFIAPMAILVFLSQPTLYSTQISPDGRFKLEIWTEAMLVAMPGSGGASNQSGTVYLYDETGKQLASTRFQMLMNVDFNWGLDKVNVASACCLWW